MKAKNTTKPGKRKISMNARAALEAYVFMTPFIIGVAVFFAFPLYLLIRLSFGNLKQVMGLQIQFAGLQMFTKAFLEDMRFVPLLLSSVQETLIKVPLTIIFSLLIAILVNKDIKFRGFFRTVFFLPFLLGNGYVMQQLMAQDVTGRAIQSARTFFMPEEIMAYLGPAVTNLVTGFFSVIIVIFWGSGVQILLFLSGLQGISPSYYEAARVESANEWDCFWHITLPMMSPIILLCVVYSLVDSFTNITNPILSYMKYITSKAQFDYASAIGLIYSLFILITVLLVFLLMKKAMYTTETRGGKMKK